MDKITVFFEKHKRVFTVLFVFSLLLYLWPLYSLVDAYFTGTTTVFFSVYVEPGCEAVKEAASGILLASIIFPVLPLSLVYQILFLYFFKKTHKK